MQVKPGIGALSASKLGLDLGFQPDEVQLRNVRVGLERLFDTIDDDRDSVVATHDIHDDSHKWKERGRHPSRRRS
jgi:hypothetical protein